MWIWINEISLYKLNNIYELVIVGPNTHNTRVKGAFEKLVGPYRTRVELKIR